MDLLSEFADVSRLLDAAAAEGDDDDFPVDPTTLLQHQPQHLLEAEQLPMDALLQDQQRRKRNRDYMREHRSKEKASGKSPPNPTYIDKMINEENLVAKRRKKRDYMRTYREQATSQKTFNAMGTKDSTLPQPLPPLTTEPTVLPDRRANIKPVAMTQEAIRQRRHRQNLSDEKKEAIRAKNRERQRQRRAQLEEEERDAMRLRDAERMRHVRAQKTHEEKELERLKNRERQKEVRKKQAVEREEWEAKLKESRAADASPRGDDELLSYATESNAVEKVIDTCLV